MDIDLVLTLRRWATDASAALTRTAREDGVEDPIAASLAADIGERFGDLDTLLSDRLRAERERLATAVRDAEARVNGADEAFGEADNAWARLYPTSQKGRALARLQAAEAAQEAAGLAASEARAALEAFDRRVNGGAS